MNGGTKRVVGFGAERQKTYLSPQRKVFVTRQSVRNVGSDGA